MAEPTVLSPRAVVGNVVKHAAHLLRIVTVDAARYSLWRRSGNTVCAHTVLQQRVAERRRSLVKVLAVIVGTPSLLVELARCLPHRLLFHFSLQMSPFAPTPTDSFWRFDPGEILSAFLLLWNSFLFFCGSDSTCGWYSRPFSVSTIPSFSNSFVPMC